MMKRVALLALSTVLATAPASAQWFEDWDTDNSGVLNEAEFRAGFGRVGFFDRWDLDDDQRLSPAEFDTGLYELWDADDDGALSVGEWDKAVDRWFGERDVNLTVQTWDGNGNGVISREEFAEAVDRTDLFARLDAGQDKLLGENELSGGLFGLADLNEDEEFGKDEEDGLFDGFFEDDEEEPELAAADPVNAGIGAAPVADAGASIIERGEAFTQLPVPCANQQGQSGSGCQQTAERFCSVLGYEPPIAFLDVEGQLYVVRCRDDL